jgi:hypothetical protein
MKIIAAANAAKAKPFKPAGKKCITTDKLHLSLIP